MKHKVSLLALLLSLLSLPQTVQAYDFSAVAPSGQTLYYTIDYNNNVIVVNPLDNPSDNNYSYVSGNLVIPDTVTYNGISYTVYAIMYYAFKSCVSLTSVTIGNSVTTIGSYAFEDCSGLTSITIPNSVTSIGSYAFGECSGLTSITIPNSVTSIGSSAFSGCKKLASIKVEAGNTHYDSRDSCNAIIQTDKNILIAGCQNTIIPNSVTAIGSYAFERCSGFTSVTIPNSVTSIGIGAFYWCYSLTSVTIPNSVTAIGSHAFSDCISLTSVTIPDSVTVIENSTFCRCYSLTSVTIPNSVTAIGNYAFEDCSGLTSVTIPNSVTYIGNYAFSSCHSLSSVNIPNSVTSIGNYAFESCDKLTSVYCLATTPPSLGYGQNFYNSDIYVPCVSVTAYQSANGWSDYASCIHGVQTWDITYSFVSDNDTMGTVSVGEADCDSNITVTAKAATGYQLAGWSDGGTGNPRTFHLTGDTAVTAFFDLADYIIIGQPNHTARGTVTGSDTVHYGDSVTLTATANYGYHFTQWSDGNSDNPRTVQVTQNKTYTAQFDYNTYTVTLGVDTAIHGTVSGAGTYNYLSNRTLKANAYHGYHFTQWNDGDTNNPRSLTLTQDTAFTALFAKNQYLIASASNDTSLGYTTGGGTYDYLDTLTLAATCTAVHHHFVRWSDGVAQNPRTLTVERDSLLTALFAIDTHTVACASNDDAMGSVSGPTEAPYGGTVTLTAEAGPGYHFGAWNDGNMDSPRTLTVTGDTSLTALFTDDLEAELHIVTVNDGRNTLVWKPLEQPCKAYRLYREGDMMGQYDLMAEVPADSVATYTDSASRPMTRSYRYRMSGVDPYGREGVQGMPHKTMHLTISKGMGNRWNLVWTEYEGAEYTTYIIYRGTSQSSLQQIDVMPAGGNTTYTDEEAPEGDVYYQVGVMMGADYAGGTADHPTKAATISRSNIATNSEVGIGTVADDEVRIHTEGGCIVVTGAEGGQVRVYDAVGRAVELGSTGLRTVPLPSGVYIVKVGNRPARRVVVVK